MKLQEYIHYYIGCNGVLNNRDTQLIGTAIGMYQFIDLDTNQCGEGDLGDFMPVLRRLEDLTEEERVEIFGPDTRFYKPFDYDDACDIKQWHALLKKGFDLFGLIDAGLAVGAKTINP